MDSEARGDEKSPKKEVESMHYRVSWNTVDFMHQQVDVEASSAEEAKKVALECYAAFQDEIDKRTITVKMISVDDLINESQQLKYGEMVEEFIDIKYDREKLSIREYSDIDKQIDKDNEADEENYLKILQSIRRYYRLRKLLLRKYDMGKYTVEEFLKTLKELWEIEDEASFEAKIATLPKKA